MNASASLKTIQKPDIIILEISISTLSNYNLLILNLPPILSPFMRSGIYFLSLHSYLLHLKCGFCITFRASILQLSNAHTLSHTSSVSKHSYGLSHGFIIGPYLFCWLLMVQYQNLNKIFPEDLSKLSRIYFRIYCISYSTNQRNMKGITFTRNRMPFYIYDGTGINDTQFFFLGIIIYPVMLSLFTKWLLYLNVQFPIVLL